MHTDVVVNTSLRRTYQCQTVISNRLSLVKFTAIFKNKTDLSRPVME